MTDNLSVILSVSCSLYAIEVTQVHPIYLVKASDCEV